MTRQRKRVARACRECGYRWYSRSSYVAECPSCKSRVWDGPETKARLEAARQREVPA
ncbi:MAG: hypothetical protein KGI89_15015 [Euryarchaeota archaeon]|nr:hypothetical protein [Euryarchaeota archaeon]